MEKFIYQKFLFLLLIVISGKLLAQKEMTLYTLNSIPNQYFSNPGLMPETKYHIGCFPVVFLPFLTSNHTNISNSGFRYNDIIKYDKKTDSLSVNMENMLSKLSRKNYLMLNQTFDFLSFGFKIKRTHYINFSISEKINFRFTYPKDLLSMIYYGNSQFIGGKANFDGIGVDMMHYREFALGYTNQIDNKWTVGGRLKLLFGFSNIWTKSTDATLAVDNDYYDLTAVSTVSINTSAPEKIYRIIQDTTDSEELTSKDIKDYLLNFNNPGFGIDLGATYKINEKWTVSASIIDFGYIFWKTGTRKFISSDKSFTFRGIEINEFIRNDSTDLKEVFQKLADSIGRIFKVDEVRKNYASPLSPTIFLSGVYNISKKDRAIAVFRADIYENTIHPAFSLAYNRRFGNILDVSVSYSYINKDFANLGLGSSVRFGPFQIFLSTDNILAAFLPYYSKNLQVHFGCNYVFYYKPSFPQWKL